jgi:hypothetical protein
MIHKFKNISKFKDGMTANDLNRIGISYKYLLSKNLIKKRVVKEIKFSIPDGSPRWASKYGFTRKKYGIVENTDNIDKFFATIKLKKILREIKKKTSCKDDE